MATSKVRWIIDRLENHYGIPQNQPDGDIVGQLIRTILSQNTSDINRDRAYSSLRKQFPAWEDVLRARPEDVASAIRVGGLSNIKGRRILSILHDIQKRYGVVRLDALSVLSREEALKELLGFEGVGVKTASCVLLFGLGIPAFPVDTHVFRVVRRLGLIPARCTVEKAHDILNQLVPAEKMSSLHLNLIRLGREICRPRNPGHDICPLAPVCNEYNEGHHNG